MTNQDFGWAIRALRDQEQVCRVGWNDKNMWLEFHVPDKHSKINLPYIFMRTVDGDRVPWVASQTDLLASDWNFPE